MPAITREIAVDIDEFDDDHIIQAVLDRGLVDAVRKAACQDAAAKAQSDTAHDLAADVLSHLLGKRPHRAVEAANAFLAVAIDPDAAGGIVSLFEKRYEHAICDLNRYVERTP